MGFEISLCKFHMNRLSERLLEGKAVTLWDELTEHKAVSQKASFKQVAEDISIVTIDFTSFQIPLSNFHKNSLSERRLEGNAVTLRWINRTPSSFSERFFPVFNWRCFLLHNSPRWASKYHFANFTRTVLAKVFLRGKLYLCVMN